MIKKIIIIVIVIVILYYIHNKIYRDIFNLKNDINKVNQRIDNTNKLFN